MARIEVLGDIEVGGERGRVINPKLCASSLTSTDYKDPQKTIKRIDTRSCVITIPGAEHVLSASRLIPCQTEHAEP